MNPLQLRDPYLCPAWRTILIAANSPISFASKIARDWDEICREEVEGNHNRADVRREFRGV